MCGIAGWYKNSSSTFTEKVLKSLLVQTSTRGKDATGICWGTDDHEKQLSVKVLKGPMEASKFIETKDFKEAIDEILKARWVLVHCRQATHGSPKDNNNNHPIFNDKGLVIHNGVVYPHQKFKTNGDTDTEQILLSIQELGLDKGVENISGSLAIAYVDFKKSGFYLYRNDQSPLVWGRHNRSLVFASARDILKDSLHPKRLFMNVTCLKAEYMPSHIMYHVTTDGIEVVLKRKKEQYPIFTFGGNEEWLGLLG
jgi:glucosamine 6-phosphate synthetase-like amidotransferase/phosphosugar isomerase protein